MIERERGVMPRVIAVGRAGRALGGRREIIAAHGVAEFRRVVARGRPTCVISDLDLFDGSGLEVVSTLLHSMAWLPPPPVILVSQNKARFAPLLELRRTLRIAEHAEEACATCVAAAAASPVSRERGAAALELVDFVLLARIGTRPVVIDVTSQGRRAGRVMVRSNNEWTATDGTGSGTDVFERLVRLTDVSIACEALDGRPLEHRIAQPLDEILRAFLEPTAPRHLPELGALDFAELTGPRSRRGEALSDPVTPTKKGGRTLVGLPSTIETESFDTLFDRAIERLLTKRYQEAAGLFERARVIRPDHPTVKANLARLAALGYHPIEKKSKGDPLRQ